jgi:hypothetical protein
MTYSELCALCQTHPHHPARDKVGRLWRRYAQQKPYEGRPLSQVELEELSDRIARELKLGEYETLFDTYLPETYEDALDAQEAYHKIQKAAKVRS